MLLSTATRKRIERLLKKNDMTLWKLYLQTGIPVSTLYHFVNRNRKLISLKPYYIFVRVLT